MNSASVGHSADVEMHLIVGGHRLDVVQLGADFLMLEDACRRSLEPCKAELIVEIDGDIDRRDVFLPEGICPGSVRTPIATRGDC
ncbi:MAG: hypothetical protein ACC645_01595 [Pirellulales bacterium]